MRRHLVTILLLATFMLSRAQVAYYEQRQLIEDYVRFLFHIQSSYVDTVDFKDLIINNVKASLKQLDPHSAYLTADELRQSNEHLGGEFEGVGIQYQMIEDTLYVIQTISGCPAEKSGILPGDRIVSVGDSVIAGVKISNNRIQKLLRGPRGTTVTIGVMRAGVNEPLHFRLTRDRIPVTSVDGYYMSTRDVGYIKINSFGAHTYEEFIEAWRTLSKSGAKKLILDLRGNGGGYLQAAQNIANEFLSPGQLITYTEGVHQPRQVLRADGRGTMRDIPVAVLVDEYSASASEIVSGALQDWDRGIIIGRRTFGKGLVQRQFPAPGEGAYRLTVSRYYTPSGRCIQKPYKDVDYKDDIEQRYRHGEMTSADSIHFADSLRYYTLVKRRTVYGGGGIMPDIFIPADTSRYTPYANKLSAKGILIELSTELTDSLRKQITKRYANPQIYAEEYELPHSVIEKVHDMALNSGIDVDEDMKQKSEFGIALQIKALVARNIWNYTGYFCVVNSASEAYKAALEELKK